MNALRNVGKVAVGLVILVAGLAVLSAFVIAVAIGWEYLAGTTGQGLEAVLKFIGGAGLVVLIAGTVVAYSYELGDAFFNWLSCKKVNREYKKAGIL